MLKDRVADRECFIHDQNIWLGVDRDGKGEAHVHARRVGLDGLMNKIADLREAFDQRQPRFGLRF